MVSDKRQTEPRKLADAIKSWSDEPLAHHRKMHRTFLQTLGGPYFGIEPDKIVADSLVNLFYQVASILLPNLFQRVELQCSKRQGGGKQWFAEQSAEVARFMLDECQAQETFERVTLDSLMGRGIAWVGMGASPVRGDVEGWRYLDDPGRPTVRQVLEENFIEDMSAADDDGVAFRGHRFTVPAEWAADCGLYDADKIRRLVKLDDQRRSRVEMASEGRPDDRLEPTVELAQLWLPMRNRLVTLPGNPDDATDWVNKEGFEQGYEGPEGGPYEKLTYLGMSGSLLPIAPMSVIYDLQGVINRCVASMKDEAIVETDAIFVQSGQEKWAEGLRDRIASGEKLPMVSTPGDPNAMVKVAHFGGVGQQQYQAVGFFMDLLNRMAGNPDAVGGVKSQTGTLGQDQLLFGAAQVGIGYKRGRVRAFTERVVRKLLWHCWYDKGGALNLDLEQQLGAGVSIPFAWSPDKREGDFTDYTVKVQTYFAADDSPQAEYERIHKWLVEVIMPLAELSGPQGVGLDAEQVATMTGKKLGVTDPASLLKTVTPLEAAPTGAMPGGGGQSSTVNVYPGARPRQMAQPAAGRQRAMQESGNAVA